MHINVVKIYFIGYWVNIFRKTRNYSVPEKNETQKISKLFQSLKKFFEDFVYFFQNNLISNLNLCVWKKLFKNYQNFSEKSPKFQELFRQQSTRFLRNIYPWLLFKKLTINEFFLQFFLLQIKDTWKYLLLTNELLYLVLLL